MAQVKFITLMDADDQARFFTEESLLEQLAMADIPGTAPIKAAFKNVIRIVRDMREAQNSYFRAAYGSSEKEVFLRKSKALEAKVDAIVQRAEQTIEKL